MLSKADRKALALLEAGGAADALECLECFTGYIEAELRRRGLGARPASHVQEARAVLNKINAERATQREAAEWVRHEDEDGRAESIASAQAEHTSERERAAELVAGHCYPGRLPHRISGLQDEAERPIPPERWAALQADYAAARERADDAARERVAALERAGKLRAFPPDPDPDFVCAGCHRPEWECSAAPCADVIADRAGEWELAAESSAPQTEDEECARRERRRLDSWERER